MDLEEELKEAKDQQVPKAPPTASLKMERNRTMDTMETKTPEREKPDNEKMEQDRKITPQMKEKTEREYELELEEWRRQEVKEVMDKGQIKE